MPGYLLDTQAIRYWFDGAVGKFPAVQVAAEVRAADSPLYVSAITLGEIEFGHMLHPEGAGPKRNDFREFVKKRLPQCLPISQHTAEPYGLLRARLAEKFPPAGGWKNKRRAEQMYDPVTARELGIDENDLWIMAQAIERNLVLVTSDKMCRIREVIAHFVPGFDMEDWATGTTKS